MRIWVRSGAEWFYFFFLLRAPFPSCSAKDKSGSTLKDTPRPRTEQAKKSLHTNAKAIFCVPHATQRPIAHLRFSRAGDGTSDTARSAVLYGIAMYLSRRMPESPQRTAPATRRGKYVCDCLPFSERFSSREWVP